MTTYRLNVATREKRGGRLNDERQEGHIPAVVYGHGATPQMLWLEYLDFDRLYREAGESSLIELSPPGGKTLNALVQEVQRDPLSNRYLHVDFYQVRMDEAIEADIPLEFVGESEAVKALSGILVKSLDEVKVKCLPKDLPHSLIVDVALLKTFDDVISVQNLVLPAGVTLLEAADTTIATVEPPRSDAEMSALNEKVEMDVTKVEGVVKEVPEETASAEGDKKEEKKEEKK